MGAGRLGRLGPAAADRAELPGHPRRADAGRELPRRRLSRLSGLPPAQRLLRDARRRRAVGGPAPRGQRARRRRRLPRPGGRRRRRQRRPRAATSRSCRRRRSSIRSRNPDGIRCTVWDSMVNVYGRDPATGDARRTLDNVGVQYGLGALNDGAIGSGAFLDLNEGIGGYDDDGEHPRPAERRRPAARSLSAYRTGRVNRTLGGYRDVPDARHPLLRGRRDQRPPVRQHLPAAGAPRRAPAATRTR